MSHRGHSTRSWRTQLSRAALHALLCSAVLQCLGAGAAALRQGGVELLVGAHQSAQRARASLPLVHRC
jgi:hypothetical protein